MKNKVVTRAQAAALIRDGDTVAFSGFVGTGTPEALIVGLEERFQATQAPRDLTFVSGKLPPTIRVCSPKWASARSSIRDWAGERSTARPRLTSCGCTSSTARSGCSTVPSPST